MHTILRNIGTYGKMLQKNPVLKALYSKEVPLLVNISSSPWSVLVSVNMLFMPMFTFIYLACKNGDGIWLNILKMRIVLYYTRGNHCFFFSLLTKCPFLAHSENLLQNSIFL